MAKLLFLGSGSAFTVGDGNFQSNLVLTGDRGRKLLIDCGSDIRFSLHAVGYSYRDITDIYISHLHSDHVGGLEYVGISRKFDPLCDRPRLYLNPPLVSDLWQHTLAGGMQSIHQQVAQLDTFFDLQPIPENGHFEWEGIPFESIPMLHVHNGKEPMPAHGLFFTLHGQHIFLTTDTQLCFQQQQRYYDQADIIFHDCETAQFHTPVHSHYDELLNLPAAIRRKIWLYGYQPGTLPDAVRAGFCGFVQRGQIFEFSESQF
jgi:ribonuclease BN (tRNA processing enzyme)